MVWHLFKKDLRLLWPMSLSVVLLQALSAALTLLLGYFDEPPELAHVAGYLPTLIHAGIILLGIVVVHQEPLDTLHADWLVRPIRRSDLLLSKMLFMLIAVNAPLMLVDIAQQLALHFSAPSSIGVAALHALSLFLFLSLPALVIGAVTRSLLDAFAFGVVSAVILASGVALVLALLSPRLLVLLGSEWINAACAAIVLALGATATLSYQYSTRHTLRARGMSMAATLAVLFTLIGLPHASANAIQKRLWPRPGVGDVTLRFDPQARQGGTESDTLSMMAGANFVLPRSNDQVVQLRLPLRVSGMHPGDVLFADRPFVHITATSGSLLYQGSGVCSRGNNLVGTACLHNNLEIWAPPQPGSETRSEQRLYLPVALFQRIANQPVRVDITYDFTRLAPQPIQTIAAVGGAQRLPEVGVCGTRIDDDGDEVDMGCLTNVGIPFCLAGHLEDPQTSARNPELHGCFPNYAPFRQRLLAEAVSRLTYRLPFRDPSGLAHYPVDAAAIERARIGLEAFEAVEHFQRTLSIPDIRLADWKSRSDNIETPY